jgi:hypothetical protein
MADMTHRRIAVAVLALAAVLIVVVVAAGSGSARSIASAAQRPSRIPIHLTGPASCASRDSSASSGSVPVSGRPGATTKLVPPTPVAVLLCHYTGMTEPAPLSIPAPAFTLESQRLVRSAQQASSLAAGLDALPPNKGVYSCPADFGQEVIAWFRYASGVADPVTLQVGGCDGVTNGHVSRLGVDGSAVTKLMGLVPAPRPAVVRVEVRLCGGPAPGGCHISSFTSCQSGHGSCVEADRAAIVAGDGDTVALIPGSYTFKLLGESSGRPGHTLQSKGATVAAGATTEVVFTVDVH